jgi:betaine reductase
LEKAGIPVVQITSALSIAKMIGANRVVLGNGIVHVTGDAKLAPEDEKDLRRRLVQKLSTPYNPVKRKVFNQSSPASPSIYLLCCCTHLTRFVVL